MGHIKQSNGDFFPQKRVQKKSVLFFFEKKIPTPSLKPDHENEWKNLS
jgi:hypothetical protein